MSTRIRLSSIMLLMFFVAGMVCCSSLPANAAAKKSAPTTSSSSVPADCAQSFFGLSPWYKYLGPNFKSDLPDKKVGGPCEIQCFHIVRVPKEQSNGCGRENASDIPFVLLAVVDSLLRVAGIVAVAFVLVGAFRYISSSGNPEETARAQSTIINALIGVAIAVVSIAFVVFLGNQLT